jgi:hypothetical protein
MMTARAYRRRGFEAARAMMAVAKGHESVIDRITSLGKACEYHSIISLLYQVDDQLPGAPGRRVIVGQMRRRLRKLGGMERD